ncbi:MAG: hypothetical protein OEZ22_01455 [Spirochaetia bacterium]|nr:hypothetical protein [Spirochaetia bacterium]
MTNLESEILIAPKVVYYIEIPGVINQKDKFNLLIQDILLLEIELEKLDELKEKSEDNIIYIFNLDKIFRKRGATSIDRELRFSHEILKFIKEKPKNHSLVHTTVLHDDIKKIFQNEKIPFMQKNLEQKQLTISTIIKMVHFAFKEEQALRTQIRINYYPEKIINVEAVNLTKKSSKIKFHLKDLSLNGLGLIFINVDDMSMFNLKDLMEVRVWLPEITLKISAGFITRMSKDKKELGLNFNLKNHKMIAENDAVNLSGIVYEVIKKKLETHT